MAFARKAGSKHGRRSRALTSGERILPQFQNMSHTTNFVAALQTHKVQSNHFVFSVSAPVAKAPLVAQASEKCAMLVWPVRTTKK